MDTPSSLNRDISPPPPKRRRTSNLAKNPSPETASTLARIEAGKVKLQDHLSYFSEHLSKASRITPDNIPRLSIQDFADLYESNQHEHGNHFVVHQHNHPRAGVHYDLRLQFSKTSSMSFALPKGLPGNPNSKSLGRMAIETRVHNLWNHLIESASRKTGSLLIWDTGTYSVLPRKIATRAPSTQQTTDDDSDSDTDTALPDKNPSSIPNTTHENTKLIEAFQTRYIRLQLHGTRLPKNYTVTLRLPSANDFGNSAPSSHRNRRPKSSRNKKSTQAPARQHTTDSESETHANNPQENETEKDGNEESLDTDDEEDFETRMTNAYPGSTNSIGSIHQRKWFLSLDRRSSGFVTGKSGVWERDGEAGFEPFYVRGREFERSVVTGRLAREVESDEGIEGFVGRAGWVGITK